MDANDLIAYRKSLPPDNPGKPGSATHLSQRGFAKLFGVEPITIRFWESGRRSIPEYVPIIINLQQLKGDWEMNRKKKKHILAKWKKNMASDVLAKHNNTVPHIQERNKHVLYILELVCADKPEYKDTPLDQCAKIIDEGFKYYPWDTDKCIETLKGAIRIASDLFVTEPQQALSVIRSIITFETMYLDGKRVFPSLSVKIVGVLPPAMIEPMSGLLRGQRSGIAELQDG
jgi:hypothetical protein